MRALPNIVDWEAFRTTIRSKFRAVPNDVLVLTLAVCGFVGLGALLARWIGVSFVLPQGESPVLGTEASVPVVVTLVVYLGIQLVRRRRVGRRRTASAKPGRVMIDLYLLGLLAVVLLVHFNLKMWVPLINERSFDPAFASIDDRFRLVIDGLRWLRGTFATILPAPDIWYDVFFFSMFSMSFWFHTAGTRRFLYHNMLAITLVEVIGPLVYLVAPAVGPFVAEQGANARSTLAQQEMHEQYSAMQAGGVAWLDAHGAAYFTAPLAAMPSLHIAAAFTLAYYAVRARLVIAPFAVFAAAWIAIEAVVARWHYLVDLPVGLTVAAVAIGVTNRLCRFRLADGNEAAREGVGEAPIWAVAGVKGPDA